MFACEMYCFIADWHSLTTLAGSEASISEQSREVALAYARSARACLNGDLHREELESLTDAVVERER